MSEISESLRARFRHYADEPSHSEAVIVTLGPGGSAAALQAAGMEVDHELRNQPIVSGRVTSAALEALEAERGVLRVEPDGEMRALDEPG